MKHHLKKFSNIILSTALAINLSFSTYICSLAFGNKTHEQLSELAFHQTLASFGLSPLLLDSSTLVKFSTGPDRDEPKGIDGYYESHFFNAETDLVKPDTALTRMEHHFELSIKSAKTEGNLQKSIKELARSLHYLQDMCCPVHVWGYDFNNLPDNLLLHHNLEDIWDAMFDNKADLHIPILNRWAKTFQSAREIGEYANVHTLLHYKNWLEHQNPALNIFDKIDPLTLGIKSFLMDSKTEFNESWEDIFYIPYLASSALIHLWANLLFS